MTIGVYTLLIFEIVVSVFVFLSVAVSKSSNILDTVEFLNVDVVFISRTSSRLMYPDKTLSLSLTSTHSLSPVIEEVSR